MQAKLNILRILSDVYKLSIVEAFPTFESKALRKKDENILLVNSLSKESTFLSKNDFLFLLSSKLKFLKFILLH